MSRYPLAAENWASTKKTAVPIYKVLATSQEICLLAEVKYQLKRYQEAAVELLDLEMLVTTNSSSMIHREMLLSRAVVNRQADS